LLLQHSFNGKAGRVSFCAQHIVSRAREPSAIGGGCWGGVRARDCHEALIEAHCAIPARVDVLAFTVK
jgi:hypothetical protein